MSGQAQVPINVPMCGFSVPFSLSDGLLESTVRILSFTFKFCRLRGGIIFLCLCFTFYVLDRLNVLVYVTSAGCDEGPRGQFHL